MSPLGQNQGRSINRLESHWTEYVKIPLVSNSTFAAHWENESTVITLWRQLCARCGL